MTPKTKRLSRQNNLAMYCAGIVTFLSCVSNPPVSSPQADHLDDPGSKQTEASVREKIEFDLDTLDDAGLTGPVDGKRAIDYEFKIPKNEANKREVIRTDPSVRFMPDSKGRVGAGPNEILCIGSTNQPRHKEILLNLAALPYVERIIICYYE